MHLVKVVSVICLAALTACTSVAEPFVTANFGLMPDAEQNLAIAAEDRAAETSARGSLTYPAPTADPDKKKVNPEAASASRGMLTRPAVKALRTRPLTIREQMIADKVIYPVLAPVKDHEVVGKPALTQLYFDRPKARKDADEVLVPAGVAPRPSYQKVAFQTNVPNSAASKSMIHRQPSLLSLVEMALLLIAAICALSAAAYRLDLARYSVKEREMRKQKNLWVQKLNTIKPEQETRQ